MNLIAPKNIDTLSELVLLESDQDNHPRAIKRLESFLTYNLISEDRISIINLKNQLEHNLH